MEEAHESESDVEFREFITYSYFCHLKQTTFVKCTLHIERPPPPPTFTFMHGFHLVPHPGGIHEIRHGGVSGTKPIRIHPHWAYNRGKTVSLSYYVQSDVSCFSDALVGAGIPLPALLLPK